MPSRTRLRSGWMWAPAIRFSSVVRCSNTRRPSNTCTTPRRTTACGGSRSIRCPASSIVPLVTSPRSDRRSPDTAFSVNDWTAFVIFITVIGGIGRVEGPIIGTIVFFALRQTLADLGSLYLLMLGAVAIAVMLLAPKGIWGLVADRFGWQLLPLERRLRFTAYMPKT